MFTLWRWISTGVSLPRISARWRSRRARISHSRGLWVGDGHGTPRVWLGGAAARVAALIHAGAENVYIYKVVIMQCITVVLKSKKAS